ncbi:Serine/threonine protein kinase [Streptomyces venezuelae]|nr:Serine/threonine protein kinase [Streptomyces venezuelae]
MDIGRVVKERKYASGGQGTVWAVKDRTINGSWPVAYKEYHARVRSQVNVGVLADMVGFVPALERGTGEWLADHTAWPAGLVTDSSGVCGFLMRRIPPRFTCTFAFDPGVEKAAGFEYLLNDEGYLRTAGITITPRQRFELLLDFARTLGRLHSLGVAVGDISPKNMFYSLDGSPGCFLIDCDAMVLHGRSMLPQAETTNWEVPTGEPKGTPASDAYKLGLLAARLFAGKQEGQDLGVLTATDPAVGRLAERSLSADPARRPTPEQWLTALAAAVTTAPATLPQVAPPRVSVPQNTAGTTPPQQGTPPSQHAPRTAPGPQPAGPRNPYVHRPTPPPPAKSHAGKWFVAITLVILAFVYGPDLYEKIANEARSGSSASSGQGTEADGSGSSAPDSEEAQARALNGLLDRNKGTRGSVGEAVSQMTACPGRSGLLEAKRVFENAASARDELLRDLEALDPGLLPASMRKSLESGWQASAAADRAYARLAEEMLSGCTPRAVTSSSQWQKASDASTRATRAKKDFVSDWNPMAKEHGLTTMSWDEV